MINISYLETFTDKLLQKRENILFTTYPTNQLTNQPTNYPTNQLTNLPTCLKLRVYGMVSFVLRELGVCVWSGSGLSLRMCVCFISIM